jgi:hypothetical protein
MIYGGIAREKCELFHFHRRKGNFIKKKYLRQKNNYRGMIKSLQQKLIFLCEGTAHTVWHANYSFWFYEKNKYKFEIEIKKI